MIAAIVAISSTTFREAIRQRLTYSLLTFAAGLILFSIVAGNLTVGYRLRLVTDISLGAVSLIGIAIAVLLGVGSIAREIERRTIYPIAAKPIRRSDYVIGKYFGVLALAAGSVLVMAVASALATVPYRSEGGVQYPWTSYVLTVGFILVKVVNVTSIAVFFSSLSSQTVAFIATTGMTVAGHLSGSLRHFLGQSDSQLTRLVGELLYRVLPDLGLLTTSSRLVYDLPVLTPAAGWAAAYAVCYALIALLLARILLERRDLS